MCTASIKYVYLNDAPAQEVENIMDKILWIKTKKRLVGWLFWV